MEKTPVVSKRSLSPNKPVVTFESSEASGLVPASYVDENDSGVVIISLDGNIGAGKSTLLEAIREDMPEVEVVQEPVGEWEQLRDAKGRSLLQLFYEDKKRWSYTFQNCAILTRLNAIKQALANTTKKVLITERSVLTDRFVFAQMLRDSGDLNKLEWELYLKWFDTFATELPLKGVIHVTTGVKCSTDRIQQRGREGESSIPVEYLTALDAQHHKWLAETDLDVLQLSTEPTVSLENNLARIRAFVEPYLVASRQASPHRPTTNSLGKKRVRKTVLSDVTNSLASSSPFTMNGAPLEGI